MTIKTLTEEQEKLAQTLQQASGQRNGEFVLTLEDARELIKIHGITNFSHGTPVLGDYVDEKYNKGRLSDEIKLLKTLSDQHFKRYKMLKMLEKRIEAKLNKSKTEK